MPIDPLPILLAAVEIHEPWPPLWVLELSAKVLLGAWLFWMGACVGSFLNVVVYRLPRGLNLVYPGSSCPRCGQRIRLRDNLPILGWLLLRGRCRDCGGQISPRYFYVELLVASAFLAVAAIETFLHRVGHIPTGLFAGRPLLTPHQTLPFWCAYATQVVLIATLLGAALIDWDGFRTPRSLFMPMLIVGLALPLFWPEIRRIPAYPGLSDAPAWRAGLIDGAAGLALGALAGLVGSVSWWLGSQRRGWPRFAPELPLAAVGVVLGWQRALLVGPGLLVLWLFGMAAIRWSGVRAVIPLSALLLLGVSPWLIEIDADVRQVVALSESDRRGLVTAIAGATAILWLLAGAIAPKQFFVVRASEPPQPPTPPLALPPDYSEPPPSGESPDPPANPAP